MSTTIAVDSPLLTYDQVADKLKVKIGFVRKRVRLGLLKCARLGHNSPRISELDLQQYIDNCKADLPKRPMRRRANRQK